VGKYQIAGSVLDKDTATDAVNFVYDTCFAVSKNVNSQNNMI
jgi:hypothetical protein